MGSRVVAAEREHLSIYGVSNPETLEQSQINLKCCRVSKETLLCLGKYLLLASLAAVYFFPKVALIGGLFITGVVICICCIFAYQVSQGNSRFAEQLEKLSATPTRHVYSSRVVPSYMVPQTNLKEMIRTCLNRLTGEAWFAEWMDKKIDCYNKKPFITLDEAVEFLYQPFLGGTCHGQAKVIAQILATHGSATSQELQELLMGRTEDIIHYQALHFISTMLGSVWFGPQRNFTRAISPDLRPAGFEEEEKAISDNWTRLFILQNAMLKPKKKTNPNLHELAKTLSGLSTQCPTAIIEFHLNPLEKHVIAIQFAPQIRVFDPYSDHTGIFEFANREELNKFLLEHLKITYPSADTIEVTPITYPRT